MKGGEKNEKENVRLDVVHCVRFFDGQPNIGPGEAERPLLQATVVKDMVAKAKAEIKKSSKQQT